MKRWRIPFPLILQRSVFEEPQDSTVLVDLALAAPTKWKRSGYRSRTRTVESDIHGLGDTEREVGLCRQAGHEETLTDDDELLVVRCPHQFLSSREIRYLVPVGGNGSTKIDGGRPGVVAEALTTQRPSGENPAPRSFDRSPLSRVRLFCGIDKVQTDVLET